jgi:hypothetical protein
LVLAVLRRSDSELPEPELAELPGLEELPEPEVTGLEELPGLEEPAQAELAEALTVVGAEA